MFTVAEAKRLTGGGLGYPSKMPGTSYGISAHDCITGAKLAKVEGSVCHGCYALKGNYGFANVQKSQRNRLASIAGAAWSQAMAFLINKEYEAACQEFMDLIHKHAKQAKRIRRAHLKATSFRSRIRAVGFGLGRHTKMDMDTTRRPAVLNPAMYPLTLPVSGAIVDLSPKGLTCTTNAALDYALIQTICSYLEKPTICRSTRNEQSATIPDGFQLNYYFRFHDSGDLQSVAHLTKIATVAALTPKVRHWLPTRELGIVQAYVAQGGIVPDNLTIRVSATMVDGPATKAWPTTSGVHKDKPAQGRTCPAPKQNNECGKCRSCWSKDVTHVSYHKH